MYNALIYNRVMKGRKKVGHILKYKAHILKYLRPIFAAAKCPKKQRLTQAAFPVNVYYGKPDNYSVSGCAILLTNLVPAGPVTLHF